MRSRCLLLSQISTNAPHNFHTTRCCSITDSRTDQQDWRQRRQLCARIWEFVNRKLNIRIQYCQCHWAGSIGLGKCKANKDPSVLGALGPRGTGCHLGLRRVLFGITDIYQGQAGLLDIGGTPSEGVGYNCSR